MPEVLAEISETGELSDDSRTKLSEAAAAFKQTINLED
jgi:hypothetical protein